jgi:hypothetical protein
MLADLYIDDVVLFVKELMYLFVRPLAFTVYRVVNNGLAPIVEPEVSNATNKNTER